MRLDSRIYEFIIGLAIQTFLAAPFMDFESRVVCRWYFFVTTVFLVAQVFKLSGKVYERR